MPVALYLDKQGKVTDVEGEGIWICSSCIDSGFGEPPKANSRAESTRPPAAGTQAAKIIELESAFAEMGHRETSLQVDLDRARAEIRSLQAKLAAATLGGTDAERLRDLEAAGRDARDWLGEALDSWPDSETVERAHARLEAMNLGDGDPDAEARAHAQPDDSAGADEGRVAALERAIVDAVGLLACHDLHGDETALAARQAFEGLGIPGLELVSRCLICAEPIEGEVDKCPDCGVSLDNGNLIRGLEAIGVEDDDDA